MKDIITAIATVVAVSKAVNYMTKEESSIKFNFGFRVFKMAFWLMATVGCLALSAWFVAVVWAEINALLLH